MAGRPCGMEHMHIIRFLGKREYGLGATALAFIVLQVYLDLKLPDYMQTITTLIVTPGTAMGRVLGEGALMLGCALGSMLATVVTAVKASMIDFETYSSGIEPSRARQVTTSARPGTDRELR